ncbi:hypothetical protein DH2020_032280 [Rehmannia glutinosa]|uniref:Prolyl endopeptidase n=1 Tax=Rehmannia glutinosa TaxID=99300 RepID=A0ABR0VFQ4_REHGL
MAAARLLLSKTSAKKTLLSSNSYLFPKLPSLALFSTIGRKSTHFQFAPTAHRPPSAKKVPFTATAHGFTWQDPYRWMSDINDPDFVSYINQENAYAEAFMRDTEEMQKIFYSEMVSRMPSKITTPPERWGPWLYYQFIPEGKEYPVLCRKPAVEKKGYVHVGTCRVSPDHCFLAYTLDTTGNEQFQLQIKDLEITLFSPNTELRVLLVWLGPRMAVLSSIHYATNTNGLTESDSRFCVDITSTKDGKFVTVNSNSRTSSEEGTYCFSSLVYVINATNPQDGLQRFCKRVSGVQYFLEHHSGNFYVLTNAPTSKDENFSNIIMPGEDICLEDMDIFHEHLVLFFNKKGSPLICSINMPIDFDCEKEMKIDDLDPWYFPLPSNMCTITPVQTPDLLVDYDMSRKIFTIVQQEDVRNISNSDVEYCSPSYDQDINKHLDISYEKETDVQHNEGRGWKDFSEKYACEEKEVVSHDGSFSRLLHGYGAYGEVLDKSWCPDRLSLLDRGWMFAFADVRGGAGVDPSWHRSGRGLNKLNSIYDFVSCGEYLITEGFIHKNRLSALGISAGCLLVGAAVNMRPELFRAAILKVPFLDVLNTLLDPTLPLTTLDYEEYGNPGTESYFKYIRKYSPYDNIPLGDCCPSMLVSASFNDSRWCLGSCKMGGQDSRYGMFEVFVVCHSADEYKRRAFFVKVAVMHIVGKQLMIMLS